MPGRRLLFASGLASLALALLHAVLIFVGPPAYRYFGAGEAMARQAESGSLEPGAVTLAIAAVLSMFGLYALSGAGAVRRLPLLRTFLVAITVIYTLRGLSLFAQAWAWLRFPDRMPPRFVVFSAAALTLGLLHLAGLLRSWRRLRPRPPWVAR
jgi:hypothetical protein